MTEPKVKIYSKPDGEGCILWSEHDLQELVWAAILEEFRYEYDCKLVREIYKNFQEKSSND